MGLNAPQKCGTFCSLLKRKYQKNKKIIIPGLIATLAIFALFMSTRYASIKAKSVYNEVECLRSKKVPTERDVTRFYQQWLDQEEAYLWEQIKVVYGVTKQECEKEGRSFNYAPQDFSHPLKPILSTMVKTVLEDFNVPQIITVADHSTHALARATYNAIFINEFRLLQYPEKAQRFVVGHELQHVINQDLIIGPGLESLIKKKGYALTNNSNNLYNRMRRFFELRADVKTAIQGPLYAQGFIETMAIFSKAGRHGYGVTHPTVKTRQHVGSKIMSAYQMLPHLRQLA